MKAVITVLGRDMVGILAKVSAVCAQTGVNIEDVTQSILQNVFAMIMIVDISNCTVEATELKAKFDTVGQEMGVQINLTRQEVFDAMHKI
ncbi:MAG: ACT domain-containing protein [Oscillospiraceae bacterium]|nr:ACT domain-containing protein [Oscillospiraceae bacterium]